jgi:hypothetical protein
MTNPYPIARDKRETEIYTASASQTVFGPTPFKIWDLADLEVWLQPAGGNWQKLDAGWNSSKTADDVYDTASITLDTARAAGDKVAISSKRLHERTGSVTQGGTINSVALEREFDRIATIMQEVRRDLDDQIQLQPDSLAFDAQGKRIVGLGNAVDDSDAVNLKQAENLLGNVALQAAIEAAELATGAVLGAYASRLAATDAEVPPTIARIAVITPSGKVNSYVDDPAGTALVTNSGTRRWSPDGRVTPDHFGENTTPGTTDTNPASQAAVDWLASKGGGVLKLLAGDAYYFGSSVLVDASNIIVDATGAFVTANHTLGPEAQNRPDGIFNFIGSLAAQTTLTADAADFAETVTVADASNLQPGQAVYFYNGSGGNIYHWYTDGATAVARSHINRIKEVDGNTVTLNSPLPRGLNGTTKTCFMYAWEGLRNVGIRGGIWEGGGYHHDLGNGKGTAAAFFEYCQNVIVDVPFLGGFSGSQIWALKCYGGTTRVLHMRGHNYDFADTFVEGANAGFYGVRLDECRAFVIEGNLSERIRHTSDGTRSEDILVRGWKTYDNHRPAHGSHNGCDNWKFVDCHGEGPNGLILWRGFNRQVDNCTLIGPNDSEAFIYDTVGDETIDLPRSYEISNCRGTTARECLALNAVIDTCTVTNCNFFGALSGGGYTTVKVNTNHIRSLVFTGGSIHSHNSNRAVDFANNPVVRDHVAFIGTAISGYSSKAIRCYAVDGETTFIARDLHLDDQNSVTDHIDAQGTYDHLEAYCFVKGAPVYVLGRHGTFTPQLGDAANDCIMHAISKMSWTKDGPRVRLSGECRLAGVEDPASKNGASGSLLLKNPPFPIASQSQAAGGGVVTWATGLETGANSILTLRALNGGTDIGFFKHGDEGYVTFSAGEMKNTGRFVLTVEYLTNV